jgi:Protein of unknown function (DUF4236)
MGFRFRHSTRLGPLRFNFSKAGLSSISLGGPGASLNVPVARSGGPRATVGLPGTGLSWSVEQTPAEGLPNSRRLKAEQLAALKQQLRASLEEHLFGPGRPGEGLWREGTLSRLLADPALRSRQAAQLAPIASPQALSAYLMGARSQDDAKRRAQRCIDAVAEALRMASLA